MLRDGTSHLGPRSGGNPLEQVQARPHVEQRILPASHEIRRIPLRSGLLQGLGVFGNSRAVEYEPITELPLYARIADERMHW